MYYGGRAFEVIPAGQHVFEFMAERYDLGVTGPHAFEDDPIDGRVVHHRLPPGIGLQFGVDGAANFVGKCKAMDSPAYLLFN